MFINSRIFLSSNSWYLNAGDKNFCNWKLMVETQHNNYFVFHRSLCQIETYVTGAPGWLSQLSVWLLISAQVMIPGSWVRAPHQALRWAWKRQDLGYPPWCGEQRQRKKLNFLTTYSPLTSPWNRQRNLPLGTQLPRGWHSTNGKRQS